MSEFDEFWEGYVKEGTHVNEWKAAKAAWQAAKADSEHEVAELKKYTKSLEKTHKQDLLYIMQQKAYINVLREALEDIVTDAGGCCNSGYSAGFVARNALASTPALKGKL